MGDFGGCLEAELRPQALGDFCKFSIKITLLYAYFSQNSYVKAIIRQFKAFKISLNVLN